MAVYFSSNLFFLRERKGLSQAKAATGLDLKRSTYANYESGATEPDFATIFKISTFFDVNTDSLLFNDISKGNLTDNLQDNEKQEKGNLKGNPIGNLNDKKEHFQAVIEPETPFNSKKNNVIDLDSKAAAGMAAIINDTDRYKSLPSLLLPWLGPGFHIRIEVTGDSMNPTIKGGDKTIATRVEEVANVREGAIYLLLDKDEGLVCKRLYFVNKNTIELVSDNEMYKPYKRAVTDILAYFRVQEVHTTDLQPAISEIRRELREMRTEFEEIKRLITR
jgi:transcriptional regulator with XRE-family HTH domain